MATEIHIPRRTQETLLADHPEGTRHRAKINIALPLLGEGIPRAAVVATLREKFPQASEYEINDVVGWCADCNPTPSQANGNGHRRERAPIKTVKPLPAKKAAAKVLAGSTEAPQSPVKIEDNETAQLLRALYQPTECVNIVCKFTTAESKGKTKANPSGAGAVKTRDEWLTYLVEKGVPQNEAGAWVRPNPVKEIGSGKDGAITNDDVTSLRFLLLESDDISMEQQLALYKRLQLPLSAIITSGGNSCHGWLRIDAADADDYANKAERILASLSGLGFDQANKNPSRLSRLPGATRKIGSTNDGKQKLLYLDAKAKAITEEQIEALAIRCEPAKFECKPMKEAVLSALEFYEDLHANKNKYGVPTGFPIFDSITGGLKRSWLTIVAGETGAGKTTYATNIIMNVLERGEGVALFSFEMDQQEIIDMIFSRQSNVNRNKFNTGYFGGADFHNMTTTAGKLMNYPLHTFDDSLMTIADVFDAASRVALDGNLRLVVIDYLQLANTEQFRESREQQVSLVSRTAKAMAKKLKVPVIGISQLNDGGKMRESRAILQDSNCAIIVGQGEEHMEVSVIKGRSIPKGTYYFDFQQEICRFTEIKAEERLMRLIPKEPEIFSTKSGTNGEK